MALSSFWNEVWKSEAVISYEVIPHILCFRAAVWGSFPILLEMVDFSWGFLLVDIPFWVHELYSYFGWSGDVPAALALMYPDLNLGVTCLPGSLLAICLLATLAVVYRCGCITQASATHTYNFLYCLFIAPFLFACCFNLRTLADPPLTDNALPIVTFSLGVLLALAILVESVLAVVYSRKAFFRVRLTLKCVLLTLVYLSPAALSVAVLTIEVLALTYETVRDLENAAWQSKKTEIICRLVAHGLLLLALLLAINMPNQLIVVYSAGGLTFLSVGIAVYIDASRYFLSRKLSKLSLELPREDTKSKLVEGERHNSDSHPYNIDEAMLTPLGQESHPR